MTQSPHTTQSALVALAAATLTASLGISVASVLLPTLSRSLDATVSDVQWVVIAYLLAMTVAVVSSGRLGDLFGHRRVLISGLIVFMAASACAATAQSLGALIAARAVQGLGGAILITLPMSLARDLAPPQRLGSVMGLLGTTSAAGTALGPSLGGLLLSWGDWHLAFWALAGSAMIALALVIAAIGRDAVQPAPSLQGLDLLGSVTLVIVLAALALYMSGASGIPVPSATLIAVILVAMALFLRFETRATAPLLPLRLLAERRTGVAFVMNLCVGTVMMSTLVVGPFYLAFSLGLSEARTGLVLAFGPAVAALSGYPAGRLTDWLGAKRVIIFGLMQMIVGLLCLGFLPRQFGTSGYVAALIILTPSFQMFLAANNTAVMADAQVTERGRLAGLLGLSRNLGLMTGASAMPALFVAFMGAGDAAQVPTTNVARAFTMTFAVGAAIAFASLGLAIWGQGIKARAG